MQEKTKFAIYTSFYNCEKYVEQLVQNIMLIDYPDWKWFVTDDFSTDRTGEFLRERCEGNPRIQYIEQSRKKEMYWEPNKFIPKNYEYILLVCADDKVDPKILQVYDSVIRKYKKQVAILTCDLQEIYEESNQLKSIGYVYNLEDFQQKISRFFPDIDYVNNLGYFAFGLGMCFKNYHDLKFVIKDYLASSEDFYRILYMTSFGQWVHVPRNLYTWTSRRDSESRKELPPNFYDNFQIALDKNQQKSYGTILDYSSCYKELNSLMIEKDLNKFSTISIISPWITSQDKIKIREIYPDKQIIFNETSGADLYSIVANYCLGGEYLPTLIRKIKASNALGEIIVYYLDETPYYTKKEVYDGPLEILKKIEKRIQDESNSWYFYIYLRHINFTTQI
jgi:glycosyltransferase involved in cell wall biosynthesis